MWYFCPASQGDTLTPHSEKQPLSNDRNAALLEAGTEIVPSDKEESAISAEITHTPQLLIKQDLGAFFLAVCYQLLTGD